MTKPDTTTRSSVWDHNDVVPHPRSTTTSRHGCHPIRDGEAHLKLRGLDRQTEPFGYPFIIDECHQPIKSCVATLL